jgi:hypothetical protein
VIAKRSVNVPKGTVAMWSGSIATIPTGWALCDGSNGTPDLRNRFVVGANADSSGVAKTTLEGSLSKSGGEISHFHFAYFPIGEGEEIGSGNYIGNFAEGSTDETLTVPPYYALAFIMKL